MSSAGTRAQQARSPSVPAGRRLRGGGGSADGAKERDGGEKQHRRPERGLGNANGSRPRRPGLILGDPNDGRPWSSSATELRPALPRTRQCRARAHCGARAYGSMPSRLRATRTRAFSIGWHAQRDHVGATGNERKRASRCVHESSPTLARANVHRAQRTARPVFHMCAVPTGSGGPASRAIQASVTTRLFALNAALVTRRAGPVRCTPA